MQQSNTYIIAFSVGLTVILGSLLALAAVSLKERQDISKKLDTKKQILSAVMSIEGMTSEQLEEAYSSRIKGIVIDFNGQEVMTNRAGKTVKAENVGEFALAVDIKKEYKQYKPEDRLYPVFKYVNESNPDKIDAYILPLFGNGLWDNIWGYLALEQNPSSPNKAWELVKGVSFDHKGETPGLGARITTLEVQDRFKGKQLFDKEGQFAVEMLKGENNGVADDPYKVDGMSGATITARGVNDMMEAYVGHYKTFLDGLAKGTQSTH